MIKTFEFKHDKFSAVVRQPKRISLTDYDVEKIKGLSLEKLRKELYEEYKKLHFPVWKRMGLSGVNLPENLPIPSVKHSFHNTYPENFEEYVKKYDYEGTDRKYTLLADVFHTTGIFAKINGEHELRIKGDSIDSEVFVVEKDAKLRIEYDGDFRIFNVRIFVGKDATLELEDYSFSSGLFIGNIFFYLSDGSKVVYKDIIIGKGKTAKSVMTVGGVESVFEAYPRVSVRDGAVDILYWSRTDCKNSVLVNGHGVALKDGKIIFRGVMDVKRGAKGGVYEESFRTLLIDDTSRFDAIPSLFVTEDDLTAKHGASSSPVPYEEIFYLQTKGFTYEEALRIISEGFITDVVDYEKVKEKFGALW